MRRLRRKIVVVVMLASGFYLYCFHRSVTTHDAAGWHLRFSYKLFRCAVCLGRVEKLSYKGRPVSVPQRTWTTDGDPPYIVIKSPVGEFEVRKFQPQSWRLSSSRCWLNKAPPINPYELARGWYDARPPGEGTFESGPYRHKKDTPKDWCLVATENHARWLEPDLILELDW